MLLFPKRVGFSTEDTLRLVSSSLRYFPTSFHPPLPVSSPFRGPRDHTIQNLACYQLIQQSILSGSTITRYKSAIKTCTHSFPEIHLRKLSWKHIERLERNEHMKMRCWLLFSRTNLEGKVMRGGSEGRRSRRNGERRKMQICLSTRLWMVSCQ